MVPPSWWTLSAIEHHGDKPLLLAWLELQKLIVNLNLYEVKWLLTPLLSQWHWLQHSLICRTIYTHRHSSWSSTTSTTPIPAVITKPWGHCHLANAHVVIDWAHVEGGPAHTVGCTVNALQVSQNPGPVVLHKTSVPQGWITVSKQGGKSHDSTEAASLGKWGHMWGTQCWNSQQSVIRSVCDWLVHPSTAGQLLGGISLRRGSQGTSSLPPGSKEFQGIPKVPPSS